MKNAKGREIDPFFLSPIGCWGIPLTQGYVALIDAEDVDKVRGKSWQVDRVKGHCKTPSAKHTKWKYMISLGRFLLDAPKNKIADHINGDGLDNRRANLRLATPHQNSCNTTGHRDRSGKYMGVYKAWHRYGARLHHKGKQIHIGFFDTEDEAALAWNKKAIQLRGEFTRLNEVLPSHS